MSATSGGGGAQLITMLVTFLLIAVPLAILNGTIAKRKGKSGAEFGWLSIIPFVGPFVAVYLVSLTDKALLEKVDRIAEALSIQAGQPPDRHEEEKKYVNLPPKDL
jgi:hypothetical protein